MVKETRIPGQGILDNAEECTPEQIAGPDIFPDLTVVPGLGQLLKQFCRSALWSPPAWSMAPASAQVRSVFGYGEPSL